jgi:DNA repair exonuclease SbcCD ATPase subunit
MNQTSIKHVSIEGMHGQYDIDVELKPSLNVIYGKNGTGKTTFLATGLMALFGG